MPKKQKKAPFADPRTLHFPPGRLKQLMRESGVNARALVEAMNDQMDEDLSVKSVYNWRQGKNQPWRTRLDTFLRVFGFRNEAELYGQESDVPAADSLITELHGTANVASHSRTQLDSVLAEKTYIRYRTTEVPRIESPELIRHLESRYQRSAFIFGDKPMPVSVIWKNDSRVIDPDSILGEFDNTVWPPLQESAILGPSDYGEARLYIKQLYEAPPSPIKAEGLNYRMTNIDLSGDVPKMNGAFGWYYDNILTQYAMEWELKRALLKGRERAVDELNNGKNLPLRASVEAQGDPTISGAGRCASITVSTLMVFNRRNYGYFCLIRRRSAHVAVSPGMLHVVPAGMFEAMNSFDNWSIRLNVWRELLEEVYGEKEQQDTGQAEFSDYMMMKRPIPLLEQMLEDGSAEFSITGLCCDLLNLRPEVCTVLIVKEPRFLEDRRMQLNWEYQPQGPAGRFAVHWQEIDKQIAIAAERGGMVVSGAACLGLGRKWVESRFDM